MKIFELIRLTTVLQMILAGVLIYLYLLIVTRVAGKRTFAKMTSLDFAITIAMGSILADAVNKPEGNFIPAIVSVAILALLQLLFAKLLSNSKSLEKVATNTPILLMDGEHMLEDNMRRALVSKSDLMGKLREANVLKLTQVKAVVFETTGDISVLHTNQNIAIDSIIMEGVKK
ncbi:MAG: YetF domain-containing protein [Maribacter sp.]